MLTVLCTCRPDQVHCEGLDQVHCLQNVLENFTLFTLDSALQLFIMSCVVLSGIIENTHKIFIDNWTCRENVSSANPENALHAIFEEEINKRRLRIDRHVI